MSRSPVALVPVGSDAREEAGQVAPYGRVVDVLEAVAQPHLDRVRMGGEGEDGG